jgi:hypothetical protein
MNRYRIKLAPPAVRFYERLSGLAAAQKESSNSDLLVSVDAVIDKILPLTPANSGRALAGSWTGIHWLHFNGLHYFYEIFPHNRVIEILSILDGPIADDRVQKADELCTEILLASKSRMSPQANKFLRAAAN